MSSYHGKLKLLFLHENELLIQSIIYMYIIKKTKTNMVFLTEKKMHTSLNSLLPIGEIKWKHAVSWANN